MITKADILKFVRHVHKRGQGIPDRRLIHPRREWLTGVAAFMLLTSVGAVWSINTFRSYSALDQRVYDVPQTVPDYNARLVETVLNQFAEREATYAALVGSVPDEAPAPVETTATSSVESLERASSTASSSVEVEPRIATPSTE